MMRSLSAPTATYQVAGLQAVQQRNRGGRHRQHLACVLIHQARVAHHQAVENGTTISQDSRENEAAVR